MRMTGWLHGLVAGMLLCTGCGHSVRSPNLEPEQALLEAAELALARGDFEPASRVFDEVLGRDPEHSRALLGSARANLSAGRGEEALTRFDAYRAVGNAWNELEQWQYCLALALASDQLLVSRERAARALQYAQYLESQGCGISRVSELLLRAGLAVGDEARQAGRGARALEIYLSLIFETGDRGSENRDSALGKLGPHKGDSVRARAFLSASELLVEARRREEALALLSRGLDEQPTNRDLVERMVALLADGSGT